jgi:four helix bundle protein
MLRVSEKAFCAVERIGAVLERIEARDRNLADQLKRAAVSVVLNLEEGSGTRGGHRRQRYLSAAGSAREAKAALRLAAGLGYVGKADVERAYGELDEVAAVLHGLTR